MITVNAASRTSRRYGAVVAPHRVGAVDHDLDREAVMFEHHTRRLGPVAGEADERARIPESGRGAVLQPHGEYAVVHYRVRSRRSVRTGGERNDVVEELARPGDHPCTAGWS